MFDFSDKVVVVTGGTGGIGGGIVDGFLKAGATVAMCGTEDDFKDKDLKKKLEQNPEKLMAEAVDLRTLGEMRGFIDKVIDRLGEIDILVNNAGIYKVQSPLDIEEDDWDATMDINLKSYFFTAKYVVKRWVDNERPGTIVNTASINAESVTEDSLTYCTSKAGVAMMTRCLARDLGQYGIRVNAVGPGTVPTSINEDLYSEEELEELKDRLALGRQGKPEEIANGVMFLASNLATYVTGQVLFIDGGWLLR